MVFLVLCVGSYLFFKVVLPRSISGSVTQEQAEEFIGHKLPADAADTHFFADSWMETTVHLKFTSSKETAEKFISELGFENKPLRKEYGEIMVGDEAVTDWWDLETDPTLRGESLTNFEEGFVYEVAAIDRGEKTNVYLVAHTTS